MIRVGPVLLLCIFAPALCAQDFQPLRTLSGHTDRVSSVALSGDGSVLASSAGQVGGRISELKLWAPAEGKSRAVPGHGATVTAVALTQDGKLLASAGGGLIVGGLGRPGQRLPAEVKLWDTQTGKLRQTLKGHTMTVWCVAFSPDGKQVASGSNSANAQGILQPYAELRLWDVETGKERKLIRDHRGAVLSVAFSADGKLLASASGEPLPRQVGQVKLWDAQSGEELASFETHVGGVRALAFSPDGKILASGGKDRAVKLWDVMARKEIATLDNHAGVVWSLAFTPDGMTLLAACGSEPSPRPEPLLGEVRRWDVNSRKSLGTLAGYRAPVRALALSADGAVLATGSDDRAVKLWQAANRSKQ
jgi:WD40 repeat protein